MPFWSAIHGQSRAIAYEKPEPEFIDPASFRDTSAGLTVAFMIA